MSLVAQITALITRIGTEFKSVRSALDTRVRATDATGDMSSPVEFEAEAQTDSSGNWSVTFPAGRFSKAPFVWAQAVSADNTLDGARIACPILATTSGCSGSVVQNNTFTVIVLATQTGLVKSGAGVKVRVLAKSVR